MYRNDGNIYFLKSRDNGDNTRGDGGNFRGNGGNFGFNRRCEDKNRQSCFTSCNRNSGADQSSNQHPLLI